MILILPNFTFTQNLVFLLELPFLLQTPGDTYHYCGLNETDLAISWSSKTDLFWIHSKPENKMIHTQKPAILQYHTYTHMLLSYGTMYHIFHNNLQNNNNSSVRLSQVQVQLRCFASKTAHLQRRAIYLTHATLRGIYQYVSRIASSGSSTQLATSVMNLETFSAL